jgi:hypothetical protein
VLRRRPASFVHLGRSAAMIAPSGKPMAIGALAMP